MDSALSHLPEIMLDADEYKNAKNGVPINRLCEAADGFPYIRLKSPENVLFGIGKAEEKRLKIERLLN